MRSFPCLAPLAAVCVTLGACTSVRTFQHFERLPAPVSFVNGAVRLSGVVLKPDGVGPFPAVVFVHGSGPSTWDRPAWRAHANAFTRGGFAVLVYDKRGSGQSTGLLATSDYDDLAADVAAAVRYLRTRSDIRGDGIGLLSRSEGGWVAPLAAVADTAIRFVIMSSGAAVGPYAQTVYATGHALRAAGASPQDIEAAVTVRMAIWDYYRRGASDSAYAASPVRDSLLRALAAFARYGDAEMPRAIAPYSRAVFAAATRMHFYDPKPALAGLRVPLLAVLGADDVSVEPATTVAVLDSLRRSGRDITIKVLSGVGHSLQRPWYVGAIYPPDYLSTVVAWARTK